MSFTVETSAELLSTARPAQFVASATIRGRFGDLGVDVADRRRQLLDRRSHAGGACSRFSRHGGRHTSVTLRLRPHRGHSTRAGFKFGRGLLDGCSNGEDFAFRARTRRCRVSSPCASRIVRDRQRARARSLATRWRCRERPRPRAPWPRSRRGAARRRSTASRSPPAMRVIVAAMRCIRPRNEKMAQQKCDDQYGRGTAGQNADGYLVDPFPLRGRLLLGLA